MAGEAKADRLLQTSRGSALLRWDTLLEVQVNIFLAYELHYLFTCEAWTRARTVIDAGCGNGYFLASLQRFFPDKDYRGVDLSPELIEVAKASFEGPGLAFEAADFFRYRAPRPADFLLMRLIVQHLSGIGEALARAAALVRPGGTLLIVEPDPTSFGNQPPTPRFMAMLAAVERHGAETKRNRADLAALGELVKAAPHWTLVEDTREVVPQVGPFAATMLHEMFLLWIDSLEAAGEIGVDFQAVRDEIEAWAQRDTAYNQIGIRFFRLEREAAVSA